MTNKPKETTVDTARPWPPAPAPDALAVLKELRDAARAYTEITDHATPDDAMVRLLAALEQAGRVLDYYKALAAYNDVTAGEERPVALIRPDWKIPLPPQPNCDSGECQGRIIATAWNSGDGWIFNWGCENGCEPTFAEDDALLGTWPFVDPIAQWRDLERAGFEVI